MFDSYTDKDITNGLRIAGYGLLSFFTFPRLVPLIFIGIAIYFAVSGLKILNSGIEAEMRSKRPRKSGSSQKETPSTASASVTDEPTIADRIKEINVKNNFKCASCGATVNPTDMKCGHCGSILVEATDLPHPSIWGDIEIDQSIRIQHPDGGEINLKVTGRIYYGELWQEKMHPDVPWTLTGGYYVGLLLNTGYLLNWQNRYFYLDENIPLTDMDINKYFADAARRYGASNQTANVSFRYKDLDWKMEDIGRFRIEYTDGDKIKVKPGAIGRFIHAGYKDEILVIEDFQSGGTGLDTAWMGYKLESSDIKY